MADRRRLGNTMAGSPLPLEAPPCRDLLHVFCCSLSCRFFRGLIFAVMNALGQAAEAVVFYRLAEPDEAVKMNLNGGVFVGMTNDLDLRSDGLGIRYMVGVTVNRNIA